MFEYYKNKTTKERAISVIPATIITPLKSILSHQCSSIPYCTVIEAFAHG